jgi:hypothetical protein
VCKLLAEQWVVCSASRLYVTCSASSVQSEKKLGVHSDALQSTLPAGVQSQCLFSRNESEVKCTPFFLEYIGLYSPFLVVFGVLRLVLYKNWSSHVRTAYYWSTILQHSNIFGVPVHHSQNVGVHIVNLWSALRLTQNIYPILQKMVRSEK